MRLAATVFISALVSAAASASETLPNFPRGTYYEDARTYLRALGYTPVPPPKGERICAPEDVCSDQPEETCPETGLHHCFALWRGKKGQLIQVRTSDQDYDFIDRVRCQANCQDDPAAQQPAAVASQMPHIAKRTPYSKVRRVLLANGFRPVQTSHDPHRCAPGFEHRCKIYPEAESCAGTEIAQCYFIWRKDGMVIKASTFGETDPPIFDRLRCVANCR